MRLPVDSPLQTSLKGQSEISISPVDVCNIHIAVSSDSYDKYPGLSFGFFVVLSSYLAVASSRHYTRPHYLG